MSLTEAEKNSLNNVLKVRRGDTIPDWELNFIWNPYIPAGAITMLYGDSGVGKSMVCCKIAADISSGVQMPGGSLEKAGKVLYISSELANNDIARLVIASGGNAKNVYLYSAVTADPVCDLLGMDFDKLQQIVNKIKPNLIIVDTCLTFMRTVQHPLTMSAIRNFWGNWWQLCHSKDCGLLMVVPVNKQTMLYDDLGESTFDTFYNMSRSVLRVVTPEMGSDAACILVHQKANYSALSDSIKVHINTGAVTWGDYSAIDADVLDFAERRKCSLSMALAQCQSNSCRYKEESES